MKTKKTVIAVLMVALLISAAFIVGCLSPDDLISVKKDADDSDYQIPAGKGVIKFNISEGNLRTILPAFDATNSLANMKYTIVLTASGSSLNSKTLTKEGQSVANAAITLNPDTYTVSIIAYDVTGTTQIAQWDNTKDATHATGVIIGPGGSVSISANLEAILGADDGTFAYSINVPAAAVCTTEVDITEYDTTNVTPVPLTQGPGVLNSGSVPLTAGYYIVDIKFTKARHQTVQYTHALHIYPTMTSTLAVTDAPAPTALVQNLFAVNFDTGSEQLDNDTVFAAPLDVVYANKVAIAAPLPTDTDMTFGGWYTNPGLTTAWSLSDDRVFADGITLYAKYLAATTPGSLTFTISFSFSDLASPVTTSATTIVRTGFDGTKKVKLELDEPSSGAPWDTVTWKIGGISDTVITSHLESGNNKVLVIDNSGDFGAILAADYFIVSVVANRSGEGPYSPPPVKINVSN